MDKTSPELYHVRWKNEDRNPGTTYDIEEFRFGNGPKMKVPGRIEHVTIALMWHTMMRIGDVHALNLADYYPDEQFVEVRHRPEMGTPIKNQGGGERLVALSDDICELLDD